MCLPLSAAIAPLRPECGAPERSSEADATSKHCTSEKKIKGKNNTRVSAGAGWFVYVCEGKKKHEWPHACTQMQDRATGHGALLLSNRLHEVCAVVRRNARHTRARVCYIIICLCLMHD